MGSQTLTKNSFFLYLRLFLSLIISLYSSRVLLDVLGVEDFGIYNVVAGVVGLVMFFRNTLVDATQRFLTIELGRKDFIKYNKVFCMCLNMHLLFSLLLAALLFTFGIWFINTYLVYPEIRNLAVNVVFIFSVLSFLLEIISTPYIASIVSHEYMKAYAYFGILDVVLKLVIIVFLAKVRCDVDALIVYSILLFLTTSLTVSLEILYVKKKIEYTRFSLFWNKIIFRDFLSFTSWNTVSSVAILLVSQGSNIVLNMFFGPVVNAARGVAFQVMGAVRNFSSSFQSAVNPRIVKLYAQKEYKKMLDFGFFCSKISYFLFLLISVPVAFKMGVIVNVWLVKVPENSVLFCQLVLLTALLESLSYPIITMIRAIGKLKMYQVWVSIILLLALPISYFMLRLGAPAYSVFLVSAVLTFFTTFTRIEYLRRLLAFPYSMAFFDLIFPVFSVSVIIIGVSFGIDAVLSNSLLSCFLFLFSTFVFNVIIIYILGFNKSQRKFVDQKINLLYEKCYGSRNG